MPMDQAFLGQQLSTPLAGLQTPVQSSMVGRDASNAFDASDWPCCAAPRSEAKEGLRAGTVGFGCCWSPAGPGSSGRMWLRASMRLGAAASLSTMILAPATKGATTAK